MNLTNNQSLASVECMCSVIAQYK